MSLKKFFGEDFKNIYKICSLLCGLPKKFICSKCFFFYGTMPVNLDRPSLIDLNKREYIILEKSDGIRYLFFYDTEKFLIIDRKLKPYKIYSNETAVKGKPHFFDGELTFNLILEKYKYLIYDAGIIYGDWRITSWDLYSRFRAVESFMIFFYDKIQIKDKFYMEKNFFYKKNIKKIFEAISINYYTKEHIFLNKGLNNIFHCNKNDGVIFSPLRLNYSLKTTCTTLKWKYEFENTMDLLIQKKFNINEDKNQKKYPFTLASIINRNKLFKIYKGKKANLSSKKKKPSKLKSKNIGEFRYLQKKGSWVLKKYRFDKKKPNSLRVLLNTFKIISESINRFELSDGILKNQIRKERGKCCEKY
jgi:hypothetical protein